MHISVFGGRWGLEMLQYYPLPINSLSKRKLSILAAKYTMYNLYVFIIYQFRLLTKKILDILGNRVFPSLICVIV